MDFSRWWSQYFFAQDDISYVVPRPAALHRRKRRQHILQLPATLAAGRPSRSTVRTCPHLVSRTSLATPTLRHAFPLPPRAAAQGLTLTSVLPHYTPTLARLLPLSATVSLPGGKLPLTRFPAPGGLTLLTPLHFGCALTNLPQAHFLSHRQVYGVYTADTHLETAPLAWRRRVLAQPGTFQHEGTPLVFEGPKPERFC